MFNLGSQHPSIASLGLKLKTIAQAQAVINRLIGVPPVAENITIQVHKRHMRGESFDSIGQALGISAEDAQRRVAEMLGFVQHYEMRPGPRFLEDHKLPDGEWDNLRDALLLRGEDPEAAIHRVLRVSIEPIDAA